MVKNRRSYSSLTNTENEEVESDHLGVESEKEIEIRYSTRLFYSLYKTLKVVTHLYGVYLLWIIFHYGASHLYIEYCVPRTWVGVITSPFLTSTPHCQGLRWMIYNGGNQINNMWITIGSWICVKLLI